MDLSTKRRQMQIGDRVKGVYRNSRNKIMPTQEFTGTVIFDGVPNDNRDSVSIRTDNDIITPSGWPIRNIVIMQPELDQLEIIEEGTP